MGSIGDTSSPPHQSHKLTTPEADPIEHLKTLATSSEIITPDSALYEQESSTWSTEKNYHPKLILRPTSTTSLSRIIKYIATTDLDFRIRCHGYGSASAHDVLISMTAFDEFDYDADSQILTLGAGASWGDYYRKMEEIAPGMSVVAVRAPFLGVGGSTLCSGFSWLSSEYGLLSDPQNMLDAEVVKLDGSVIWASKEPELLWALRGTETGFAVVTRFKFRVRPYPSHVYSGSIFLPKTPTTIAAVVKGVQQMDNNRDLSLKVSLFVFFVRKEMLATLGATEDKVVVYVYDAEGEAHGRSEAGFKWALDIPGAQDMTTMMSLREVADSEEQFASLKGSAQMWWTCFALPSMKVETMERSLNWYDRLMSMSGSIAENGYLIFELHSCRDQLAPNTNADSGWPRPRGFKHTLLIGSGCAPDAQPEEKQKALDLVLGGPRAILGESADPNIIANVVEDFHDLKNVYGENLPKLRQMKARYDPQNKLNGKIRAEVGV